MLQRIAQRPAGRKRPAGLVLVPTRELAMQVAEAFHKYGKGLRLGVVPVYGGAPMPQQIRALERGAAVVVATPGRALDHIRRKTLALDSVQMVVLDEADEMLDMGFAEDLEAILQGTPPEKQTALFSATMPARILAIAERHLQDPARVTIAREQSVPGTMPRVRQLAYIVGRAHKVAALGRVLDMENPSSAIVFCRTRLEVESLVDTLNAHGFRAEALHGGMQQRQRDRVMNDVRGGKADLLVATDVAARGLDIEHVSHVVNYDVPSAPEAYVHRIGRTGRAGRAGTAITLAEPREHRLLRTIEQFTKQKIEVAAVPTTSWISRPQPSSWCMRRQVAMGTRQTSRPSHQCRVDSRPAIQQNEAPDGNPARVHANDSQHARGTLDPTDRRRTYASISALVGGQACGRETWSVQSPAKRTSRRAMSARLKLPIASRLWRCLTLLPTKSLQH
jgi:ATP-dependent RNA helicase DeaD